MYFPSGNVFPFGYISPSLRVCVVDRSKPPVWHQVEYVSEVLDNSALSLGWFGMVKSDAVSGLFMVAITQMPHVGYLYL